MPTLPSSSHSPAIASSSSPSASQHQPSSPSGPVEPKLRLNVAIGGMSCASCSSTITSALSQLDGVSDVAVSVIESNAFIMLANEELVDQVVETIEDCGFQAQVVSVEPLGSEKPHKDADETRTISLRVDGMFCPDCPEIIMSRLSDAYGSHIHILKPLTDLHDPVLTLSYQPNAPTFTIRHIISTISHVRRNYSVSIHHPPSQEDISRRLHSYEKNQLLRRLILSIIIAIPTFIIGIVFMSLVKNNPTQEYLMSPMWNGKASRAEWALFFLSTPVMFYCANHFHSKSIKEIKTLWRRGSSTPILRRFYRFGSMNLLVSTGVSVAYFSSIVLLALSASQRDDNASGFRTTYFDSVVFLTMFLLAGRFMESYSKSRTADAVSALRGLRPESALLVVPRDTLPRPDSPRSSSSSPTRVNSDIASSMKDLEKSTSIDDSVLTPPHMTVQTINSVSLLEVGDIVRVPVGSTPPADGTIIAGHSSSFDESSLTGESKLVHKNEGDHVYVGTVNKVKMVDIRVESIGSGTMLDRIITVVREGQTKRAPIERVADLVTGFFVPVVTLLAIVTWVIWLGLGFGGVLPDDYLDIPLGGWAIWSLQFSIAVFVVACPCGIGLAAPTALLVGSGLAAKYGILARGGGEAFQEMSQLDILVFDKTGTITEGSGKSQVTDSTLNLSAPAPLEEDLTEDEILGLAYALEESSSHPLAQAIRDHCKSRGVVGSDGVLPVNLDIRDHEEVAGRGLSAVVVAPRASKPGARTQSFVAVKVLVGSETWMEEHGIRADWPSQTKIEAWRSRGDTVVFLVVAILQHNVASPSSTFDINESSSTPTYHLVATFAISDTIRPESKAVIAQLQKQGITTWMISGDGEKTAKAVAKMVGIPSENVMAGVMPDQKAAAVRRLQLEGQKRAEERRMSSIFGRVLGKSKSANSERCVVGMVGDGINDAPALAMADVGIAIGSGSDVAISSASFILLSSNLQSLITLSDLSRRVIQRVKFNFVWAMLYNLAALPIAAGVLYPVGHHIRLDPVWASLAMALSSISVVCSSLLLRFYKPPKGRQSTDI